MIERYTLPEMGALWSEQNKFQKWLDVEVAVCEVHAEMGTIPREAVAEIKARAAFTVERIREIEKTTDHDVIAFTTALAEQIGEAARFVHYGLTSSDVVDTANALLLRDACDLLLQKTDALLAVLKRRAFEFKETPQVGRTHGVHAEPTSFGLAFALWYDETRRNRVRLERARDSVAVGKISGAVGAFAHLDPEVEERVCARLGLKRRARLDAGHPARRLRRVPDHARHRRRVDRKVRPPGSPLAAHGGARGGRAFQEGAEGLVGDAAQAQPDPVGAAVRDGAAAARLRVGRP